MKGNRPKLTLVALASAFLFLLLIFWLRPREPVHQERPLSAWLAEWEKTLLPPGQRSGYIHTYPAKKVASIEDVIRQMGPEALPFLRRMLRTRDTVLRSKAVTFCAKHPWIPIHFRPPAMTLHQRGLFGIRVLGPAASPAVPELVGLLTNPHWTIRASAADALGKIGPAAGVTIPALIERLADNDPHVRAAACHALASTGASQELVLPPLMSCVRDTNSDVFNAALHTAARLGTDPSRLIPATRDQLRRADPRIRYEAALALGHWGQVARSAIPELLEVTHDPDKDVREAAAGALIKIDPNAASQSQVPAPPGPADDAATGTVTLALQGPSALALDIYKSIAGVELVMKVPVAMLSGHVQVRATRPLSPKEAVEFLEQALLDQAGIVLERIDATHVAVNLRRRP